MLARYWTWTSGAAGAANSGIPFGPLRYRAWTSGPPQAGLSFGPLRYRAWTSGPPQAGLSFGPLRYRAWTNGDAIIIPPIVLVPGGGSFRQPVRLTVEDLMRLRLKNDDELLLFIVSAAIAGGLLD